MREILAAHCATALGKRLALAMGPSTKAHVIRDWLAQVREMLRAAERAGWPPLGGVYDIRNEVRASAFPTPLEADALARVMETLAATAGLRAWVDALHEDAPSLKHAGERIADLSAVAEVIAESIDARGQVRDYATPKLASIRGAIESARGRIKGVFDRLLRQAAVARMLQYAGATFHDDRMVLPLKAEYRGRIQGIVHRSSDSGSTLFVEPAESVELNNTIVRLRDDESKEITHILRGLTQRVSLNAQAILATLRAVAVLDLAAAKCRYAKARGCVCPEIDDNGALELLEARHPLLLELFEKQPRDDGTVKQVVPIDVRLGDDFDVLVITGPNTGGKTVTLKTVGLLALMAQCGLPIPVAEGSRVPIYEQIHIDIGDEQSLQQSLSTFSSHMSTLLSILTHSGPRSLVLIDELGAGTDPDEGAAIGRAVLAELLHLGARVIVTTHLSALKAVAFTEPRVDNASVEFDVETLQPTYRLRLGEPGNSNALIIAKRLGMPARLVKSARQFLDDRMQALNRAIAGTIEQRREAEQARRNAREAAIAAQHQREQFEKDRDQLAQAHAAFARWSQWLNALQPGDEVFLKSLKRRGRVVRMQLHKQVALVSAGALDIEVPFKDLDTPTAE